jgi:deoxyribose-phosphate aldolase
MNQESVQEAAGRPPLVTYEDLAQRIDHSLVRPELTDEDIAAGCRLALDYRVAAVFVRPSDADFAVRMLEGSSVKPGSVVGFPHGSSTTAVKLYEARDLLRRGVQEIDMVLNIGKLLSRQFQYLEMEVLQIAKACHENGAVLKVILENAYLTEDLKIIACKICKRAEADFAKTSTGFAPGGSTPQDLVLMKRVLKDYCGLKAASGIRTLEAALEAYRLGADRIGATHTAAILDEWKAHLAAQPQTPSGEPLS